MSAGLVVRGPERDAFLRAGCRRVAEHSDRTLDLAPLGHHSQGPSGWTLDSRSDM